MRSYSCQVVIVGSGAGGGAAVSVLSRMGVDVIILEQGKRYEPSDHKDIVSSFTQLYINAGITIALGNPPIPIPQGCAVGGTTLINSSTCFRPPREKVDAWEGPAWEALEPWFEEIEARLHVHPVDESLLGGNYRVLKRGCDALGVSIRPLLHNLKDCQGSGRCAFGCPTGAKQSVDRTFIPDAIDCGARLLPEHKVTSVIVKGSQLKGVMGIAPEGPFVVHAEKVILAMGALATPAFLLIHRLANRSGRVGRGLKIHPACRVVAELDEVVDGGKGLPQGAFIDQWMDQRVMLEGISLPPGPLLSALPGVGSRFKDLAARYRNISTFGIMVSDTGQGRVYRGYGQKPFIMFYQFNQADAHAMRFGMARLAELYFAAGAKRVYTNCFPFTVLESLDDLRKFEKGEVKPRGFEMMAFHPTGTCAISSDPTKGVVNARLQSHDISNLYVMDASVIPCALGVNPQITIMALAMLGAYQLAEDLKCQ